MINEEVQANGEGMGFLEWVTGKTDSLPQTLITINLTLIQLKEINVKDEIIKIKTIR